MTRERKQRYRSYLEKHGGYYRVRLRVPPEAQGVLGVKALRQSLRHGCLSRANEEQRPIVLAFKQRIKAALTEARRRAALPALDAEALEWNANLAEERVRDERERKAARHNAAHIWDDEVTDEERFAETVGSQLSNRVEAIATAHGMGVAERFRGIAEGSATPLTMHVEEWLRTTPCEPKRAGLNRRAIRKLAEWCAANEVNAVVEAITPRIAALFEDDTFPVRTTPAATFASYRTALRSYWAWLHGRGIGPAQTPWQGRQRAALKAHRIENAPEKRPFTDAEVATLLAGEASERLHDAMRIAALSGMRLGEIGRLRIHDCVEGVFNVRIGKTTAGQRVVPIHSQLVPMISRLTGGRAQGDYLIDGGLDEPPADAERTRSGPLTKEFVRYRRRLKVDEKPDAHRQSNVNFHSFRRWFIDGRMRVLAEGGAPFTEATLKDVVGHDRGALGMTAGTYAGVAPVEEKRRCVEAVGLPSPQIVCVPIHNNQSPGLA